MDLSEAVAKIDARLLRIDLVGLDAQRFLPVRDRVFCLSLLRKSDPEIVVRFWIVGRKLERLFVLI